MSTQARQVGRDTPRFGGPAGPLRLGLKADTYTQRAIPGSDLFCQGMILPSMLSYLCPELLYMLYACPLAFVAVGCDGYSVRYSPARLWPDHLDANGRQEGQ